MDLHIITFLNIDFSIKLINKELQNILKDAEKGKQFFYENLKIK